MTKDEGIQRTQEDLGPVWDIDCYKIMRDIAETQNDSTWKNKRALDGKAQNIIVFSGIISSIYIGIATQFLGEGLVLKNVYINTYNVILLLSILGAGAISSIYIDVDALLSGGGLILKLVYTDTYKILMLFFIIGITSIVISIYWALLAYNIREWDVASKPNEIILAIRDKKDINKILTSLSIRICETIESNEMISAEQAKLIKRAIRFLVAGIIICTTTSVIIIWVS